MTMRVRSLPNSSNSWRPDGDPAPAGGVGRPDARPPHDDALGGEVGALDVVHQVGQGALRVVQHLDGGVDDLPHVVGGDVGGHAHGDAAGAVHQQVGNREGRTLGSRRVSSKLGSQSTVSFSMSRSISSDSRARRASVYR